MTNYGRVNYVGLYVRTPSPHVLSLSPESTGKSDAQTNKETHTHTQKQTHTQAHPRSFCVLPKRQ